MVCPLSEELRQQWKENILNQRSSGLSMAAWCRRSKIAVHNFYYWQKTIPQRPINRAAFTEIAIEKNPIISYVGFILEVSRGQHLP